MVNELKKIFENILSFKKRLLFENVNPNDIKTAIKQHKILFIYYDGDDTILKGYRTIRPFVYGKHKTTGNYVVRAWQDAGSSDSYKGLNRIPRQGHEKQSSPKGGIQPGWRLFRIDGIKSIYPTGYEFKPKEFFITNDGVKYNPNDKDIEVELSISKETPDKTDYDKKISRYDDFFKHAEKINRSITKDEIEYLSDVVTKYRKKAKRNYWVVQNDKGDMV